jgi:hypothetical protein
VVVEETPPNPLRRGVPEVHRQGHDLGVLRAAVPRGAGHAARTPAVRGRPTASIVRSHAGNRSGRQDSPSKMSSRSVPRVVLFHRLGGDRGFPLGARIGRPPQVWLGRVGCFAQALLEHCVILRRPVGRARDASRSGNGPSVAGAELPVRSRQAIIARSEELPRLGQ